MGWEESSQVKTEIRLGHHTVTNEHHVHYILVIFTQLILVVNHAPHFSAVLLGLQDVLEKFLYKFLRKVRSFVGNSDLDVILGRFLDIKH